VLACEDRKLENQRINKDWRGRRTVRKEDLELEQRKISFRRGGSLG
jgi:hypothetical protein